MGKRDGNPGKHARRDRPPLRWPAIAALSVLAGIGLGFLVFRLGVAAGWRGRATGVPPGTAVYTELGAAEPTGLNPLVFEDPLSRRISSLFYSGLTRLNGAGEPLPDLATGWTVANAGRVWTFELRRGVKWHDGHDFTAADVVFTYGALTSADFPGSLYNRWQGLQIVRLDAYTVKFTLPAANPLFPIEVAVPILPEHLLGEVPYHQWKNHQSARSPVGTGPFKFAAWTKGKEIVTDAYAAYHFGRPAIGRFRFKVAADVAGGVKSGAGQGGFVPAAAVQGLKQAKGVKVWSWAEPDYWFLAFNAGTQRPWRDVRLRQALAQAIDKVKVAQTAAQGNTDSLVVVDGPFVPGWWPHAPGLKSVPYEASRARELLSAAGWHDANGDGFLESQVDNRPLSMTITTVKGQEGEVRPEARAAAAMVDDFKAVGVKVQVEALDFAAVTQKLAPPFDFDAVLLHWPLDPNPDVRDLFASGARPAIDNYAIIRGGANFVGLTSTTVDRLLNDVSTTTDFVRLKEAYHRLEQAVVDMQPYVFLWAPEQHYAVQASVDGPAPGPWSIFWNVHQWRIKK